MSMGMKLTANPTQDGHSSQRPWARASAPPLGGTLISSTSRVMAIANTPSLNASSRALDMRARSPRRRAHLPSAPAIDRRALLEEGLHALPVVVGREELGEALADPLAQPRPVGIGCLAEAGLQLRHRERRAGGGPGGGGRGAGPLRAGG